MEPLRLGAVVKSKAGRDKAGYFAVVEIVDENFVRIADGRERKLDKPKLKKLRHLEYAGQILESIGEKLANHVKVHDAEIFSALRKFNATEELCPKTTSLK